MTCDWSAPSSAEQISDPVTAITTGLPLDLTFATKGELAVELLREAYADDVRLDFVTGDEVYGACGFPRRLANSVVGRPLLGHRSLAGCHERRTPPSCGRESSVR